ncbi:MAG: hypothetical protein U0Y82_06705 [Thermoleophilia bacterium]
MRTTRITDSDDPRLAEFVALRDGDRRFARPAPAGVREVPAFAVEGRLVVERALAAGLRPLSLLWDEARLDALPPLDPAVSVISAPYEVIRHATGFGVVREGVALFARPPERDPDATVREAATVMLLEGVANPVNLGVLVRTAAALGVDATLSWVIALAGPGTRTDHCCTGGPSGDPWVVRCRPIPSPASITPRGRCRGFRRRALYGGGTDPGAGRRPLPDLPGAPGRGTALPPGAEGPAFSVDAQRLADVRARIPMAAEGVDSLNVAAAAAVACYAPTRRSS